MTSFSSFDPAGTVGATLRAAVEQQGRDVLANVNRLRSTLAPLQASAPQEVAVLLAASSAGLADLVGQHTKGSLDAVSVARLSAGLLQQRSALDGDAALWACAQFIRAVGYAGPDLDGQLRNVVAGAPSSGWSAVVPQEVWTRAVPPAPTAEQSPGNVGLPSAAPKGWEHEATITGPQTGWANPAGQPAPTPWPYPAGPTDPNPAAPAAEAAWGASPASGWPSSPPPQRRRRNPWLLIAPAVALLVVIYLGVAAAAHIAPFSKSTSSTSIPKTSTTTSGGSVSPTTSTSTPGGTTARTISTLLPGDVQASSCGTFKPPFTLKGASAEIECSDSSLQSGLIFAFQVDNASDYKASLSALNTFLGFDAKRGGHRVPSRDARRSRHERMVGKDRRLLA